MKDNCRHFRFCRVEMAATTEGGTQHSASTNHQPHRLRKSKTRNEKNKCSSDALRNCESSTIEVEMRSPATQFASFRFDFFTVHFRPSSVEVFFVLFFFSLLFLILPIDSFLFIAVRIRIPSRLYRSPHCFSRSSLLLPVLHIILTRSGRNRRFTRKIVFILLISLVDARWHTDTHKVVFIAFRIVSAS